MANLVGTKLKSAKPSATASAIAARLASADAQIDVLNDLVLPQTPHLLQIPSNSLAEPQYDFWKNNLFDKTEGRKIEYLTLQSSADRGICLAQGNWWDETTKGGSPLSIGSQTGASTPHTVRDPKNAKVKLSFGEYKNLRTNGVKPAPRPATATPDAKVPSDTVNKKPLHSRNTSAVSIDAPMSRVPSLEGVDTRPIGTSASTNSLRAEKITTKEEKPIPPRLVPSDSRDVEKSRPTVNGNTKRDSLQIKDANKDPRPARPDMQRYDPNPSKRDPRPRSPHKSILESKQQKRPLESAGASQPEKRTKIESTDSRTPSNSQKTTARKTLPSETRPSPNKPPKAPTSAQASPLPKKVPVTTRPIDTKSYASKGSAEEKPHIPPLLSPLPADLSVPSQSNVTALKKLELDKSPSSKTPVQKSKTTTASDTIVVKPLPVKTSAAASSPHAAPASSTPPFVLPRMLSPSLPDIVEAELTRLQHKSTSINTVEARYEKVRQPGAPGVPQKATRPKIGHPPKKSHAESSQAKKPVVSEKRKLIVKMKYGKKYRKNVERILRLRPSPKDVSKEMGKPRLQTEENYVAPVHFDSDSEEEEEDVMPLPRTLGSKAPASTVATKRVPRRSKSDSDEDSDSGGASIPVQANRSIKVSDNSASKKRPAAELERVEPAPKRSKVLDTGITKVSTPLAPGFKSPTISGPSSSKDNHVLSTPKRSEAAKKSTAMGRVISSDGGHARTPKAPATSTPASSEKVRTNGHRPVMDPAQVDHAQRQHKTLFDLGTRLKRLVQASNNARSDGSDKSSVATERTKAAMKGVESIMAYMLAFYFSNQLSTMKGHSIPPESWKDLFPVWNFVNNVATPYTELAILLNNLAAVAREQMCKFFIETPPESRDNDAFVSAHKDREKLWARAKMGQPKLQKLYAAGSGILGPWTSVPDAIAFGAAVLERYAEAHGVKDWEGEESLKHVSNHPQPPRMAL